MANFISSQKLTQKWHKNNNLATFTTVQFKSRVNSVGFFYQDAERDDVLQIIEVSTSDTFNIWIAKDDFGSGNTRSILGVGKDLRRIEFSIYLICHFYIPIINLWRDIIFLHNFLSNVTH